MHVVRNVSHYHMHHHVYAWVCMMGITPCIPRRHTHMGYPPIHIGTYMYVCLCTYTAWGIRPPPVYPHVHTTVYIPMCICQVPVLPTHATVLVCAWVLRGGTYAVVRYGFRVRARRVAPPSPPASPPSCTTRERPRAAPRAVCAPLRDSWAASQGPICPSEAF